MTGQKDFFIDQSENNDLRMSCTNGALFASANYTHLNRYLKYWSGNTESEKVQTDWSFFPPSMIANN